MQLLNSSAVGFLSSIIWHSFSTVRPNSPGPTLKTLVRVAATANDANATANFVGVISFMAFQSIELKREFNHRHLISQ